MPTFKLSPQEEAELIRRGATVTRMNRAALGEPFPGTKMSEKEFMAAVIALAKHHGWKVYHTHDSRRSEPGFPDLVLARDRVIFAELKVDGGKVSAPQAAWIDALQAAGQLASVWTPDEWEAIVVVLSTTI